VTVPACPACGATLTERVAVYLKDAIDVVHDEHGQLVPHYETLLVPVWRCRACGVHAREMATGLIVISSPPEPLTGAPTTAAELDPRRFGRAVRGVLLTVNALAAVACLFVAAADGPVWLGVAVALVGVNAVIARGMRVE
jgi:hypothetical protein